MVEEKEILQCWQCGASLVDVVLPFRRLECCPGCEAELHVCRMCRFYAPDLRDQCAEEMAEEVRNKESANFCDYFKPRPGAHQARAEDPRARTARAQLDDLFESPGDDATGPDVAGADAGDRVRQRLKDLFDDQGG